MTPFDPLFADDPPNDLGGVSPDDPLDEAPRIERAPDLPSLGELRAAANGDLSKGIACPKCGCRHLEVRNTIPRPDGTILRYRVCRYCRTVIPTVEIAEG